MPIEAIPPSASLPAAPTRAPKQAMDSEVFMHLLVTQLRNQDPGSPMDTNQMIAQTTQLAMMEQLTTMAGLDEENFSLQMRTSAAALIDREVSYLDADGATVTGIARSVSFAGPVPTVNVNGVEVALDALTGITRDAAPAPATT